MLCKSDGRNLNYISFVVFADERPFEYVTHGYGPQVVVARLALMFRRVCWLVWGS